MSREGLLVELDRLLDWGEPLLSQFPKLDMDGWWLELPDNISDEMAWYAREVSFRAWNRERYQDYLQAGTTDSLAVQVEDCEVGLLGWRAIGALR